MRLWRPWLRTVALSFAISAFSRSSAVPRAKLVTLEQAIRLTYRRSSLLPSSRAKRWKNEFGNSSDERLRPEGNVVALEVDFPNGMMCDARGFLTFDDDGRVVSDHTYGAAPTRLTDTND